MKLLPTSLLLLALASAPLLAVTPDTARIRLTQNLNETFQIAEIQAFEPGSSTNVALQGEGGVAAASTIDFGTIAGDANDGNLDRSFGGGSVWHSDRNETVGAWIQVTLTPNTLIDHVTIFGRDGNSDRQDNFNLELFDASNNLVFSQQVLGLGTSTGNQGTITILNPGTIWDTNNLGAGAGGPSANGNWSETNWTTSAAGTATTGFWDNNFGAGNTAVFSAGGDATGSSTIVADEAGVVLTGATVEEGNVTIAAGAGDLSLSGAAAFDVAGGSTLSVSEALIGTGGLTKTGTGNLTLSNRDNSYAGGTTVNDGTLTLNGPNSAISLIGTGDLTINADGRVDAHVNAFGWTYENAIAINGGVLNSVGADSHLNTVEMTGGQITGVEFRPHEDFTINASPDQALISARLNLFDDIDFNVGDGAQASDLLVSGQIVGGAGNDLSKSGDGTMTLTAANTYSGATTIDGGTLQLGDGGGTGSLNTASTIVNDGTFAINQDDLVIQGTDFSGAAITGTGGLEQLGDGTTILTADNTYSGDTTVVAGVLIANNPTLTASATGTGDVNVESGATLAGEGSVGDAATLVTVESGGFLSPGGDATATNFDVNTLTFGGALTLDASSTTTLQLLSPMWNVGVDPILVAAEDDPANNPLTTESDGLDVGGLFTTNGTFDLVFDPAYLPNAFPGDAWDLADFGISPIAGSPSFNIIGDLGPLLVNTDLFASTGIIYLTPEPSRALLLLIGLGALVLRRRR